MNKISSFLMIVIFAVIFIELGNAGAIQSKIKKMQESIDTPSHQKKDKSPKHEEGSGSSSDEPHNNNSDSENEESSKKSEHKHRGKEAKKYEKLEKVKSDDYPSGCSD